MTRRPRRAAGRTTAALLRLVSRLVPSGDRAAWLEEWNADLWQLRHRGADPSGRRVVRHVLGAVPHALTIRLETFRMNLSWQDMRYALRAIISGRMTTLISIVTLAIGIGATATVFCLMHGVILRQLPYPEADRLVALWPDSWFSERMFRFLEGEATSYTSIAAWTPGSQTLQIGSESENVLGPRVTDQFFEVLGAFPSYGRNFVEGEDEPGHAAALISYDLWQRRFGGRGDVVGRAVTFSGVSRTIVGVLPAGLDVIQTHADVVVSATLDPSQAAYDFLSLRTVIARLAPSVTRDEAEAELLVLARRWGEQTGQDPAHARTATVVPLHEFVVGDARPTLILLFGAVGCTLLIVIANVSNLQLAQSLRRSREFAVRLALGAPTSRLGAQLVAETTLIALCGALMGMVIVAAAVPALVNLFPGDLPRGEFVRVDAVTLVFTGIIGLVTGGVIAGLPLAQALRSSPREGLWGSGRAATASRSRRVAWSVLVSAEVALALTLLIGGGLLIKSFKRTLDVNPGFEPDRLATVWIRPAPGSLATGQALADYHDRVDERLAAVPGVEASAGALAVPIIAPGWWFGVYREGFRPRANADWPSMHWRPVTPDYFATAGIRLLRGRLFDASDRLDAPQVTVISQHTADTLFPDRDPIGQRLIVGVEQGTTGPLTIVGIVENVTAIDLRRAPVSTVYRPWQQAAPTLFRIGAEGRYAILRSSGDPASILRSVTAAIHEIDATASVAEVQSMNVAISESLAEPRATIIVLAFFAAASLALGALGVYGVMAFNVGQRTKEVSIRMALGATRGRVLGAVLVDSLRLVAAGIVAGLVLSVALTRLLERFLFQVETTDLPVFVTATGLLTLVGAIASYLPGRRASRLAPVTALRGE